MDFRILSYPTVHSGSDVIPVCFCYADSYVKYRPLIFMCQVNHHENPFRQSGHGMWLKEHLKILGSHFIS